MGSCQDTCPRCYEWNCTCDDKGNPPSNNDTGGSSSYSSSSYLPEPPPTAEELEEIKRKSTFKYKFTQMCLAIRRFILIVLLFVILIAILILIIWGLLELLGLDISKPARPWF